MLELSKLNKENAENYMADLIDQLKYLFTHVDANNFTADMRAKWESIMQAVKNLETALTDNAAKIDGIINNITDIQEELTYIDDDLTALWGKVSVGNLRNAVYPVGSRVVSFGVAQGVGALYGGTWEKEAEISTNSMETLSVFKRIS